MNYREVKIKRDEDGHNYIIPADLENEFDDLLGKAGTESDPYHTNFIDKFDEYMTGGRLSDYKFYIQEGE